MVFTVVYRDFYVQLYGAVLDRILNEFEYAWHDIIMLISYGKPIFFLIIIYKYFQS